MSPASMNARSSSRPPRIWALLRSGPADHWITNSTSSATSSSEEWGSGPSSAAKYRSKKLIGASPRSGRSRRAFEYELHQVALDDLQRRRARKVLEDLDRFGPGVLREPRGLEESLQLGEVR